MTSAAQSSGHNSQADSYRDRRTVICAAAFGLLLFLALFSLRLFTIPSASMAPALEPGNAVIVSRAFYGISRYTFDSVELPINGRWPESSVGRGDVVVFRQPQDHKTFFVKRVVGLPGDRIQIIGGVLNINGQPAKRERIEDGVAALPFCRTAPVHQYRETLPNGASYVIQKMSETCPGSRVDALDNTEIYSVPPANYFMLGDNRDSSADSRLPAARGGGYVPEELIIGRVITIF
jgi:signal peptidase I